MACALRVPLCKPCHDLRCLTASRQVFVQLSRCSRGRAADLPNQCTEKPKAALPDVVIEPRRMTRSLSSKAPGRSARVPFGVAKKKPAYDCVSPC